MTVSAAIRGNLTDLAHNFYAPFYYQYIPATSRPPVAGQQYGERAAERHRRPRRTRTASTASSIERPRTTTGSFAWSRQLPPRTPTRSACSRSRSRVSTSDYRPLPYGDSSVSVYTDESGEANVNYVPGLGMYFDNLSAANKNLNGGCDLENVDPIGTAHVDVDGAVSVPAGHGFRARRPIRSTSRCTTCSRRRSPCTRRASTRTTSLELGRQDRPRARAGHRRLAAGVRAGLLDGRHERRGLPGLRGDLPAPTADDPNAVITPRSVPRAVHDVPGSVRPGPAVHVHGSSRATRRSRSSTRTRPSVDVIAEFVNEGILRDTIADFGAASLGQTPATTSADGPPTAHVPSPTTQQHGRRDRRKSARSLDGQAGDHDHQVQAGQAPQEGPAQDPVREGRDPVPQKAKLHVRVNGKPGMVALRITILKGGKTAHVHALRSGATASWRSSTCSIPARPPR